MNLKVPPSSLTRLVLMIEEYLSCSTAPPLQYLSCSIAPPLWYLPCGTSLVVQYLPCSTIPPLWYLPYSTIPPLQYLPCSTPFVHIVLSFLDLLLTVIAAIPHYYHRNCCWWPSSQPFLNVHFGPHGQVREVAGDTDSRVYIKPIHELSHRKFHKFLHVCRTNKKPTRWAINTMNLKVPPTGFPQKSENHDFSMTDLPFSMTLILTWFQIWLWLCLTTWTTITN